MRAVFVGAGTLTTMTAERLLALGHDVVIIETDKARIDALAADLDAAYIHGDGTKPAIQREASPEQTDFLYCLTDNDQSNILASLVGRSLGYPRVVTRIESSEYEHICIELGLQDVIIPDRTIARYLVDKFSGHDPLEVSALVKEEARVFSFIAGEEDEGPVGELDLPEQARIMYYYRDNHFQLASGKARLKKGDQVVIVTHSDHLAALQERWEIKAGPG